MAADSAVPAEFLRLHTPEFSRLLPAAVMGDPRFAKKVLEVPGNGRPAAFRDMNVDGLAAIGHWHLLILGGVSRATDYAAFSKIA